MFDRKNIRAKKTMLQSEHPKLAIFVELVFVNVRNSWKQGAVHSWTLALPYYNSCRILQSLGEKAQWDAFFAALLQQVSVKRIKWPVHLTFAPLMFESRRNTELQSPLTCVSFWASPSTPCYATLISCSPRFQVSVSACRTVEPNRWAFFSSSLLEASQAAHFLLPRSGVRPLAMLTTSRPRYT